MLYVTTELYGFIAILDFLYCCRPPSSSANRETRGRMWDMREGTEWRNPRSLFVA